MDAAPEQIISKLTLEKEILLTRLEAVDRDLHGSVERLDELVRELDQINDKLASIDDQLRVEDQLLAAS